MQVVLEPKPCNHPSSRVQEEIISSRLRSEPDERQENDRLQGKHAKKRREIIRQLKGLKAPISKVRRQPGW